MMSSHNLVMKLCSPPKRSVAAVVFIAAMAAKVTAQDPSIDRLLSKLPPPEKLTKSPLERALQQPDPALKDPIARQVVQAAAGRNFRRL
jgi:hypothetical protein